MWNSPRGPEAHFLLEMLAYLLGARIFWVAYRTESKPDMATRVLLMGSAIFGAFLGSKLLHIAEHLPFLLTSKNPSLWLGGKSVMGGLLGGTFGTELAKKAVNWTLPTGDPWVPALAVGLIVGRLGCQLSGTWDQTYGNPTALPWAWDYGDGVGRHPTGFYEMLLVAAAFAATRTALLKNAKGAAFAAFLLLYCLIRFGIEFLKPPFGSQAADSLPVALYAGLTAIQWAALIGTAWFGLLLHKRLRDASL